MSTEEVEKSREGIKSQPIRSRYQFLGDSHWLLIRDSIKEFRPKDIKSQLYCKQMLSGVNDRWTSEREKD